MDQWTNFFSDLLCTIMTMHLDEIVKLDWWRWWRIRYADKEKKQNETSTIKDENGVLSYNKEKIKNFS